MWEFKLNVSNREFLVCIGVFSKVGTFSFFIFLDGGAPTPMLLFLSICSSVSLGPSVRLSIVHHVSGTVRRVIIIFGTHVQNDDISRLFFIFLKFWWVIRGGGIRAKNSPKWKIKVTSRHVSYLRNSVPYTRFLFIFSKFWFLRLLLG